MPPRFYAISDESQITASRFRSIASVSLPTCEAARCNSALAAVLNGHGVREFKWHDLAGATRRFCAIGLIDRFFDVGLRCGGRIDVLVWDTQDSRHGVPNRDDTKNFERMYFHLHKALMQRRPAEADWHLRPDEKLGIDWQTLQDCLGCVGDWRRYTQLPLLSQEFSVAQFHVRSLKQLHSCDLPLCQLADLFAGMAAYTRSKPELVQAWIRTTSGQHAIFEEPDVIRWSNADKNRLPVILHLKQRAVSLRLGVSLNTEGYLKTPDPSRPVNFWHYVPQSAADRAPTRQESSR
jgi:hypothetical protein